MWPLYLVFKFEINPDGDVQEIVNVPTRELSRKQFKQKNNNSANKGQLNILCIISSYNWKLREVRTELNGEEGDRINAILAGSGFNIMKHLRTILLWLFIERFKQFHTRMDTHDSVMANGISTVRNEIKS